ncbi:thioredoxin interacting protein b isoform X1 [Alosa sapidissima]|uniref:thioredoxin interacting protein b isoform X1 n=1 Tax=Alosa sapidissima TaxID=34773 RepID=UPI001C093F5E|nr:thioredoxin interacting protein b isoform X1 [Alosa sapidissima]
MIKVPALIAGASMSGSTLWTFLSCPDMVVLSKKPKTFEVLFNDPSKTVYYSGDKVAGRIIVEVSEVMKVSAMRVFGIGNAKVEYLKGKRRCHDAIDYLKYEDVVHLDHEQTDTDGCVTFRPGNRYEYMFGFELPQQGQLVSSYDGKFGHVHYYVKAVMERPSQSAAECKKYFEVVEPLDVNTPDLKSPVAGMKEKKVTCMFIPDGSVSIQGKIDRKGYCEGEDICINAKFENTCSRIVVPKAAIIARHIYLANGKTKVIKEKLCSVRGNHIISGMCDMWQGKRLRVPKIKPTILGCNIIHVDYSLMLYIHIPGSDKLTLELPMVVGTLPYGFGSRSSSMSSQQSAQSSNWISTGIPSSPPSYSEIPQDLRVDSPLTPLLEDYDEDDAPIFMRPPPAYTEMDDGVQVQFC